MVAASADHLFGGYQLSVAPNCVPRFPSALNLKQTSPAVFSGIENGLNIFLAGAILLTSEDSTLGTGFDWQVKIGQDASGSLYTGSLANSPLLSARANLVGQPNTPCNVFFSDYLSNSGARLDFICQTQEFICTATYLQSSTILPVIPNTTPPPIVQPSFPYVPPPAQPSSQCFGFGVSKLISFDAALQCLHSVPFNSQWKASTIAHLRSVIPFYTFLDINVDSGPPANIQVDLYSEIDRVEQTTYQSDFEFHVDILNVFRSMRDAHTVYSVPSCYNVFFYQPYSFDTVLDQDSGDQIVIIRGSTDPSSAFHSYYFQNHNIDTSGFAGWIIDTINGIPALQALIDTADQIIGVKNRGVRFNQLISGNGFSWRTASNAIPPPSDSVTYQIHHPITSQSVTFSAPWIAYFQQYPDLSGVNDMLLRCSPQEDQKREIRHGQSQKEEGGDDSLLGSGLRFDLTDRIWHRPVNIPSGSKRSATVRETATSLQLVQMDSDTGVIVIPGFGATSQFFEFHLLHTLAIQRYGLSRLIIDLTSNSGGSVFLGAMISGYLSPEVRQNLLVLNNYDQIGAPLWDELVPLWASMTTEEKAPYSGLPSILEHYLASNPSLTLEEVGATWYTPGKEYERGGIRSIYSQLYEHSNVVVAQTTLQNILPQFIGVANFPADSIILLTDGACGSTCAIFIRSLQYRHRAKVIGFGGIVGESLDSNSFAGGTIEIVTDLINSGAGSLVSQVLLPTVAGLQPGAGIDRFTLMEAYGPQSSLSKPAEFVSAPVDARINAWGGENDRQELYYKASQYFQCCFSWQDSCDAPSCSDASLLNSPLSGLMILSVGFIALLV